MAEPRLHRGNVAVVIPALNESLRIREVVSGALHHCDQVIVVDDGSEDGTADCISDLPVTVLSHSQRLGKGAALRSGFAAAGAQGAQAVLTMDGDGQHSADDIPRLIDSANRNPGCVIIGARLRKRSRQPWYRRIGNDFGDWGISWGCGLGIVDSQSGQRLYPRAIYTLPDVPGEGFVFEAQMLITATRQAGAGVVSLPVETRYADGQDPAQFRKSHFRLWRDLYRITAHVVRQVIAYGDLAAEYRRTRATPPVIDEACSQTAADAATARSGQPG